MYKKTKLDNGVRVVTAEMRDVGSLAAGIWIKTGSRHEEQGLSGISHYLEHLVFKGTRHYSCQQIKESIEGVGGSFNGFTSEETTCYLVKMPAKYLDRGLDILSEMVLCPSLPDEEIEKERTVILEEIKMYKDLPQSYVHELIDELLWPDQPLGRSILGTHATVSAIKRTDLDAYRRSRYTGSNVVISCAGNVSHAKVCARVKKAFSNLAQAQGNSFEAVRAAHA
ncbi:MAG: pitrilysin family protein, partial [Candidatus Omnitrophica bacterium]|nr:pitrilysin family protein [Candidatus Omnitrophota bacterium]